MRRDVPVRDGGYRLVSDDIDAPAKRTRLPELNHPIHASEYTDTSYEAGCVLPQEILLWKPLNLSGLN